MTKFIDEPREKQIEMYVGLCDTLDGQPANLGHLAEHGISAEKIASAEKTIDDMMKDFTEGLAPEDLVIAKKQAEDASKVKHYVKLRLSTQDATPEELKIPRHRGFADFMASIDDLLAMMLDGMSEELAAEATEKYEKEAKQVKRMRDIMWETKLATASTRDRLGNVQEFAYKLRTCAIDPPAFLADEVEAENAKGKGNWCSVKIAKLIEVRDGEDGAANPGARKSIDKIITVLANDGDRDELFHRLFEAVTRDA